MPGKKKEDQDKYVVQCILDIKMQNGEVLILVKWLNWELQYATWEPYEAIKNVSGFQSALRSSPANQHRNVYEKLVEVTQKGSNPYQQTRFKGHFLYGDVAKEVKSLKIFGDGLQKQIFLEIIWETREDGYNPINSFLSTKTINEYDPRFLAKYYEQSIRFKLKQNTCPSMISSMF